MCVSRSWQVLCGVMLVVAAVGGCRQQSESPNPDSKANPDTKKPPQLTNPDPTPPMTISAGSDSTKSAPSSASTSSTDGSKELIIQGLGLVVPQAWVVEPFQPGGMAGTVAAYRLPKAGSDSEDAILKISHFPGMKGKDNENIDRWLAQVTSGGKPITREEANYKVEEKGNIRLTTMDAKGAIATSMTGGGTPTPGQRMIAAIIDHPQGPHFVKVTGGEATIAQWRDSFFAMFASASAK